MSEKVAFVMPKLVDSQALSDIAKRADAKLGKLAAEFHELLERQRGSMATADNFVRDQVKVVDKWIASGGSKEKQKNLNDLIYSQEYGATIYQVDPTRPRSDYKDKTDESGNSLADVWDAQRADKPTALCVTCTVTCTKSSKTRSTGVLTKHYPRTLTQPQS
jgi:hypothetical protein